MDVVYNRTFQQQWQMNSTHMADIIAGMRRTHGISPNSTANAGAGAGGGSGGRVDAAPRKPSFVITNSVDENWGFFSTKIHSRTGKWLNMTNHLKLHGSSYETVQAFLSHPSILLVAVNTHVDPNILTAVDRRARGIRHNHNWLHSNHSQDYIDASVRDSHNFRHDLGAKVICLPLGVKHKREIFQAMKHFVGIKIMKKRLLTINNSGWGDRTAINAAVSRAFNFTTWNTYSGGTREQALAYAATEVRLGPHGSGRGGGGDGNARGRTAHHKHHTPRGKRKYSGNANGGDATATATASESTSASSSEEGIARQNKQHRQRNREQKNRDSREGEGGGGRDGAGSDAGGGRLGRLYASAASVGRNIKEMGHNWLRRDTGRGPGLEETTRVFSGALSVGTVDSESSSYSTSPLINRRALKAEAAAAAASSKTFNHKLETAEARFALCPSGLGFDTYRLWETLLLGTIPIVESNIGFDRTYSTLPVLVVRNFSVVTPHLLYKAYPCFIKHAQDWNFNLLTMQYWLNLLDQAVSIGDIAHVTTNHPMRNKHCDFLDYDPEADAAV